jgi:hypothetical protein
MPRFMMLMIPGSLPEPGDYGTPEADDVAEMMRYNEELTKSGALLALDGLQAPSKGARVTRSGGQTKVIDGPFPEAKEVVGGYWIIQAGSKEEAVEWARRCPLKEGDVIEVRQVFETSDFPEDVQAVAQLSEEPPEQTTAR